MKTLPITIESRGARVTVYTAETAREVIADLLASLAADEAKAEREATLDLDGAS